MEVAGKIALVALVISLIVGMCTWGVGHYIHASIWAAIAVLMLRCKSILNVIPLFIGAVLTGAAFWFAWCVGAFIMGLSLIEED